MILNVGVDVGNSDTKSENTVTPSGFITRGLLPYGADDCLFFNGKYYVPDPEERFPYKKDKTVDDNMFILTLFAIAKEALFEVSSDLGARTKEDIQRAVSGIDTVNLGVGLPPAHCSVLGEKTVAYYKDRMGSGVSFSYNGIKFSFRLDDCRFFPQDWAAIVTHSPDSDESVVKKYSSYYAVDIGGYTVDVVPIMNRKPAAARCASLDMGILCMYSELVKSIEQDHGKTVKPSVIEDVLRGKPTILPGNIREEIFAYAREWSNNIIRSLAEAGVFFDSYPVVFLGGGAEAFRECIKENPAIQLCEFIFGANVNAMGYTKLLQLYRLREKEQGERGGATP